MSFNFSTKALSKFYLALTILLLLDLLLYLLYAISLAGKLPDQILFWTWLIMTPVVILSQIRKRWTRIYGLFLIGLSVLSLFPLGVPFLTLLAFMIPDADPHYLYHDDDIRVELTTKSVIGKPYIAVVKNYVVIEREIAALDAEFNSGGDYLQVSDIKSVTLESSNNDQVMILVFDFGTDVIRKELPLRY